ncbi:hypothetical protein OSB04_005959 [Centaurea solstitialis]|uniref:Uncharacterized protein n=1 Tax=Centaurea solstitialis TaxID=347529 RepID=A0AA38TIS3_9ASTR|nr:hypothetical protein OSB04_005959 [Centaurea solstitialis]
MVKKKDVPDLTLVDLPGFIRIAVEDQPRHIYRDILELVKKYIKPEETIILNVVASWAELQMCESFDVSRPFNDLSTTRSNISSNLGRRTIVVITKCDQRPEDVVAKVSGRSINVGLGFVCVRNRIDDETYAEARKKEASLFETDPMLSKLDKSMVGIPVLANKLMEVQAKMIAMCLPNIMRKVSERLHGLIPELAKLPRTLASVSDARGVLIEMVGSIKDTLQNLIIRGEYGEYEEDMKMHGDARGKWDTATSVRASFRISPTAPEKAKQHFGIAMSFINEVWGCLETICIKVFEDRCKHYRQLLPALKASAQRVLEETKEKFKERAAEMIEMEQGTDYTCDPNHATCLQKLLENRDMFVNAIQTRKSSINMPSEVQKPLEINIEGYGSIDIKHLVCIDESLREQAFDMKMRITAYWEVVVNRMVGWAALQLRFMIRKMVIKELPREISKEMMANDAQVEKMIAEPPSVAAEREALQRSIKLLQESKEVLQNAIESGEVSQTTLDPD